MLDKLDKEGLLAMLEKNSGVYPDEIPDADVLFEAGLEPYVALLPKSHAARMKYVGNMFAQMCFNHRSNDPKLKMELTALGTALSYLLNSTSFIGDEYKDFDRAEIDRKLGRKT